MAKLTKAQRTVLEALDRCDLGSAYELRCSLNTLNSLSLRHFVRLRTGLGAMAFPRTAQWQITPAGRAAAAISENEHPHD